MPRCRHCVKDTGAGLLAMTACPAQKAPRQRGRGGKFLRFVARNESGERLEETCVLCPDTGLKLVFLCAASTQTPLINA